MTASSYARLGAIAATPAHLVGQAGQPQEQLDGVPAQPPPERLGQPLGVLGTPLRAALGPGERHLVHR
jgi:hypothetical protein